MGNIIAVGIPSRFGLTGAKTAYKDENILLGEAQALNFVGAGVVATLNEGVLTVEVEGGGSSINVVDDLDSTSATDALSANQGNVLDGRLQTVENAQATTRTREDVTFSATALANNAIASNTVNIASRYQLLHITTNHPCRVRLYTSIAKRDADLTRPLGTDPEGNHGLMFEFISTTELLSADLSPVVDGFADTAAIPYSITNLSGATQTITVTLNHVKTGA